jgi:hypothetical protein
VPVKPFESSKEICFGKITVEHTHRIVYVHSGYQPVAGFLDGLQVPGRYITSCSYDGEIFHLNEMRG